MLDSLEGIRSTRNLRALRQWPKVGLVASLFGRRLGRVESRRSADGRRIIPRCRGAYDRRDVKGRDHVAQTKGPVDDQPSNEARRTIVALDCLYSVDNRRGVESESDDKVGGKGRAHDISEEVAALATGLAEVLAGEFHALAAFGDELSESLAKDGSHGSNSKLFGIDLSGFPCFQL